MDLDDKVCYCFHVSKRKIINFIRVHKPSRASQISECGGAGTGCGWCVPFLKSYFRRVREGDMECADPVSPEEYSQQRAAYVRAGRGVPASGAEPLPPESAPRADAPGDDRDAGRG